MGFEDYMWIDDIDKPIATSSQFISTKIYESVSPCRTPPVSLSFASLPECLDKKFSVFGDHDCGEPQVPQHVVIDFSPNPEYDNPETQQKCIDFWDFINSRPDIQHLCVMPDPNLSHQLDSVTSVQTDSEDKKKKTPIPSSSGKEPHTALSHLEISNKHDYLQSALDVKMPTSMCSLGTVEYDAAGVCFKIPPERKCQCKPEACKHSLKCSPPPSSREKKELNASNAYVRAMCAQFDQWDEQHPKSMDPPGTVMQRLPILVRQQPPPAPRTCKD